VTVFFPQARRAAESPRRFDFIELPKRFFDTISKIELL
jgi:hypothetical protein